MTARGLRVLDCEEFFRIKLLVCHQVEIVLGILVELLVGIVGVDIAGFSHSHDMRVLRKRLVSDRTVVLTLVVLEKWLNKLCDNPNLPTN